MICSRAGRQIGEDLNRLMLIGRICRRNQADKDETCGGRADRALQDRDEGHGDTPWQEARGEQLRCGSPYSSTRSGECRPGSKTCPFVSSAAATSVRFLAYSLNVRSKKSTNAR